MSKLRSAKPAAVIRVLEKKASRLIRQSVRHAIYRHLDGDWMTIPIDPEKDVAKGTVYKIINDMESRRKSSASWWSEE